MTLSAFLNAIFDITIPFLLLWSSRHALSTRTSIDRCVIQWLAFIAYMKFGAFIDTWFRWLPLYDASRLLWSFVFLVAQLTGGDLIYRPYIRRIFHDHSQVFDIVAEVAGALLLFCSGILYRVAHVMQKGHAAVPYLRLLRFPLDVVLPWWNTKETFNDKNRFWGVVLKSEAGLKTIETNPSSSPSSKAPPLDSHASPLAILEASSRSSSSSRARSVPRPHDLTTSPLIWSVDETNKSPARRRTTKSTDDNQSSTKNSQIQSSKSTKARPRNSKTPPSKTTNPKPNRSRRKQPQEAVQRQEASSSIIPTDTIPKKRKSPPASTNETVSTPKRQKTKPAQGATRSSKRIRKARSTNTTGKSSSPSRKETSSSTSRTRSKPP